MPDKESEKSKVLLHYNHRLSAENRRRAPEYAELEVLSNFSFLKGASHPEELIAQASELGTRAIALTDYNSLAGVVRGHLAAKEYPIQFIVGTRLQLEMAEGRFTILVYPTDRQSYGNLCRLLTLGKKDVPKEEISLALEDFLPHLSGLQVIIIPPYLIQDHQIRYAPLFKEKCAELLQAHPQPEFLSMALHKTYTNGEQKRIMFTSSLAAELSIPLVVTNDVHFHLKERFKLQQVLSCIKNKTTLHKAGFSLHQNAERYLKHPAEMWRLFKEYPKALLRTIEIAENSSSFSLEQLQYEYPSSICAPDKTPALYLRELVVEGLEKRYPNGTPLKVKNTIEHELNLIHELQYEKYFLTCYDIVKYARSKDILCQGRGAAANSSVCYALGITSVDPSQIDLLFARFISKERTEPPDIDIDFEHERREEVIQYIYEKYGRRYAGLTAGVVTYRHRSAIREVSKALGFENAVADKLAKSIHRWSEHKIFEDDLRELKLDQHSSTFQHLLSLTNELIGFPRHLTQHVGGFIICKHPLDQTVPILNAAMPSRTIIEWDKDDIEALGVLKIDVLALGMLTCIRKAFALVNKRRQREGKNPVAMYALPIDDKKTYAMISKADTLGVFQVESRAQMSMLPRLKPQKFYDLVVQIAIVRPGPIQGDMIHPYLKRRNGLERYQYPDAVVQEILGKTYGVPIFQEQAMNLAIKLADFTPGEAEKLRRAMASWKRNKKMIATFQERIIHGMRSKGYTQKFAETCITQLKGFAEYGFPESHAASFAHIAYASCWIKCHYHAEFVCALLNSQPMGFYHPAQIITDAKTHGVHVADLDINNSDYDCTIEQENTLRIGMRYAKGVSQKQIEIIVTNRNNDGVFKNIEELWLRCSHMGLTKNTLEELARADAFCSFSINSREALFAIQKLITLLTPLDYALQPSHEAQLSLPLQNTHEKMFQDYNQKGYSLRAHPIQFVRAQLTLAGVVPISEVKDLNNFKEHTRVTIAGIAIVKQKPPTAKGMCFLTIEDETAIANLLITPNIFDITKKEIMMSQAVIATGKLQRIGELVYVMVERIKGIDAAMTQQTQISLPNKSYSY